MAAAAAAAAASRTSSASSSSSCSSASLRAASSCSGVPGDRSSSARRAWRTALVTLVPRRAASSRAMACTWGSLMFMPMELHG